MLLKDLIERDEMELDKEKESSQYYRISVQSVQYLTEHMNTEGVQSHLQSLADQLAEDTDPEHMLDSLYNRSRSILDECLPKVTNVHTKPTAEQPRNWWFDMTAENYGRKCAN